MTVTVTYCDGFTVGPTSTSVTFRATATLFSGVIRHTALYVGLRIAIALTVEMSNWTVFVSEKKLLRSETCKTSSTK
jgi:hypothetical protein